MNGGFCLQYVIGAIFRDILIWSATGEAVNGGSGYYSMSASNGVGYGQAIATLPTSIGVVTDFFIGFRDRVSNGFNFQCVCYSCSYIRLYLHTYMINRYTYTYV